MSINITSNKTYTFRNTEQQANTNLHDIALSKTRLHIMKAKDTFIISCAKGRETGKTTPQSVQNKMKNK